MKTCALASGSSGNCFYIEHDKTCFLVDAGISSRQIIQRLESIGRRAAALSGIFITHEHIDHVRGVDALARKFSLPVFLTRKCHAGCRDICSDETLVRHIEKDTELEFGGVRILPFSKNHDACDPVSYAISANGRKVSVMTDIGSVTASVVSHLRNSNIVYLESNHDISMLEQGPYPEYLKVRILSDRGQLSNLAAARLVEEHGTAQLKHLVLSHLSESNNTRASALRTMKNQLASRSDLGRVVVSVSGRHEPTALMAA